MLLARVVGNATSTVKHESFAGWRLLVVAPMFAANPDPLLAIDSLGAGTGSVVVISNDGQGTREMMGSPTSPARWAVVGIVDSPKPEWHA